MVLHSSLEGDYVVGRTGATVRSGPSLNSEKTGRLQRGATCGVRRVAECDGVVRGELTGGGWVSLWVLKRADGSRPAASAETASRSVSDRSRSRARAR